MKKVTAAKFEPAFTRYLAQFENDRKFDSKTSLQDFDAKEKYLLPKNRPVSIQKHRKMFCLHHYRVFTRCCFKFRPVRVPFSKSTVFEICRQKMCHFRVNRRPIRQIFHRFQNVPAWCERSLSEILKYNTETLLIPILFRINQIVVLFQIFIFKQYRENRNQCILQCSMQLYVCMTCSHLKLV